MILAIIQARMSSKRLPGKVLMEIAGKPMLRWVIDAAQEAKLVDKVIVATSNQLDDEAIIDCAVECVDVFPGDLHDVLDRFYRAGLHYRPAHIVRLTGDCPMLEPGIIDAVIHHHLRYGYEYTSNNDFVPSGMNVEVFTMGALTRAAKLATSAYDREHVTPYMQNRWFDRGEYPDYDGFQEKVSVDTLEDFENVSKLLEGRVYGK